jgi:uncharacterized iron-regulated membrane protein
MMPPSRLKARDTWIGLHRYLALSLGLLLVFTALTGGLSLFAHDLDRSLNPGLKLSPGSAQALSLDRIMATVREVHPDRIGPWTLELPDGPDQAVTAWYDSPRESAGKLYAPLMVAVNPYTGQVIGSRIWGTTLATKLLDLHTQLGLEAFGRSLVGILGALLIVSTVSGLYLWWPGRERLRAVFSVDTGRMIALAFDGHRLMGLFLAVPLLILAVTGLFLAFPKLPAAMLSANGMEHGAAGAEYRSTGAQNDHPVGIAEAGLIARGPFPRAELRRITLPSHENGTYRVTLRQRTELNQRHPYTTVWVDRWSGQIREVRNPSRFSAGETFMAALWPIHTGEAWGPFGKSVWVMTALAPLLLYLSGLMRWLNGRGWLADRPLDWSRVRILWNRNAPRLQSFGGRVGSGMIRQLRVLGQWALAKLKEHHRETRW